MSAIKKLIVLALLLIPTLVLAQAECPAGQTCIPNPLGFIKINSPGDLILAVLGGFSAIMGAVAIAFTVFNGFKLVIAGSASPGKDEKINEAKAGLTWAVGGFIVAILSFTIISGVAKLLGFEPSLVPTTNILESPLAGPSAPREFISVMNYVMINFLGLLGFATTLTIIYYGYRYITSAGNEEAVTKAKEGLKWAIIGLVVTLLAFTIITIIRQWLVFGG